LIIIITVVITSIILTYYIIAVLVIAGDHSFPLQIFSNSAAHHHKFSTCS